MKRKTVLNFCYILKDVGTVLFKDYIKRYPSMTQKDYSLSAVDHVRNLYAMFQYSGGIVSNEETTNGVQLTSIPKGISSIEYLTFNKDAYSTHYKKYNEYQTWVRERNVNRFKMNKEHGKNYDSKNMAHCIRLLDMVTEILDKGAIIVRRPKEHIELLMKMRRGEMEYEDIFILVKS